MRVGVDTMSIHSRAYSYFRCIVLLVLPDLHLTYLLESTKDFHVQRTPPDANAVDIVRGRLLLANSFYSIQFSRRLYLYLISSPFNIQVFRLASDSPGQSLYSALSPAIPFDVSFPCMRPNSSTERCCPGFLVACRSQSSWCSIRP